MLLLLLRGWLAWLWLLEGGVVLLLRRELGLCLELSRLVLRVLWEGEAGGVVCRGAVGVMVLVGVAEC